MKERQFKSCRSDLSLGGITNPAENCCIPSREKGDAGSGSLLKHDPFFSPFWQWAGYSNDTVFSCLQEGQVPAASRLFPLVLVSQREVAGGGGLQLFVLFCTGVFCPKGGCCDLF